MSLFCITNAAPHCQKGRSQQRQWCGRRLMGLCKTATHMCARLQPAPIFVWQQQHVQHEVRHKVITTLCIDSLCMRKSWTMLFRKMCLQAHRIKFINNNDYNNLINKANKSLRMALCPTANQSAVSVLDCCLDHTQLLPIKLVLPSHLRRWHFTSRLPSEVLTKVQQQHYHSSSLYSSCSHIKTLLPVI